MVDFDAGPQSSAPVSAIADDVVEIREGHLGLDHPKLREVAACVRVLRAEGGAEGVDVSQCARHGLSGELAGHRKEGRLTEEVL